MICAGGARRRVRRTLPANSRPCWSSRPEVSRDVRRRSGNRLSASGTPPLDRSDSGCRRTSAAPAPAANPASGITSVAANTPGWPSPSAEKRQLVTTSSAGTPIESSVAPERHQHQHPERGIRARCPPMMPATAPEGPTSGVVDRGIHGHGRPGGDEAAQGHEEQYRHRPSRASILSPNIERPEIRRRPAPAQRAAARLRPPTRTRAQPGFGPTDRNRPRHSGADSVIW